MTATAWRAAELKLPGGVIALDVSDAGCFARQCIAVEAGGVRRAVTTLGDLSTVLRECSADIAQLTTSEPVSLALVVCVLTDRPRHVLPRETMWPEMEEQFSLNREACEPRFADGEFQFVAYSRYMPVLTLSRLTVDLARARITEEVLVDAPWPPVAAPMTQEIRSVS